MSAKRKNGDEITFNELQQVVFSLVWAVLGIIATAIATGLALSALITYGRDSIYALMAGNLGNLILNLIAFGVLGVGLSLIAILAFDFGIYTPWQTYFEGGSQSAMRDIYKAVVRLRYGQPDGEVKP
jgi:hypothetical protein